MTHHHEGPVLDDAELDERRCYVCGGRDDHPRDVTLLPDGSFGHHHFDCGAFTDPPCGCCSERVKASGNKSGGALRKFLKGGK